MTIVLALGVFLLIAETIVCMHSVLRAGRDLEREIDRVTEGRERE